MKILHLGDLHFGKRINNLSLIEDQIYINKKILEIIDEKGIEAVLIAGDVYDRSVPSEEAVNLFDDFLVKLAKRKLPVMIIAGNHDSAERLSFGDRLIEAAEIYISPVYDGTVKKITLEDKYGEVNFYLMPFVKPANVRQCFPEEKIETYTDALRVAVSHMDIDTAKRNIIVSHQFVTGAHKDGSEDELFLGGSSNVDSSVYEGFDYTALGHIHRPQNVKHNTIRYCGSPMKFSFNEERQNKGLTIVDIRQKGDISIELLPLEPMRDFVTIRGKYDDIRKGMDSVRKQDFVSVILTDEDEIPNAFSNLSIVYPNIQKITYDNRRTNNEAIADGAELDLDLKPIDLIKEFYELGNGLEINDKQEKYLNELIEMIWGGQA